MRSSSVGRSATAGRPPQDALHIISNYRARRRESQASVTRIAKRLTGSEVIVNHVAVSCLGMMTSRRTLSHARVCGGTEQPPEVPNGARRLDVCIIFELTSTQISIDRNTKIIVAWHPFHEVRPWLGQAAKETRIDSAAGQAHPVKSWPCKAIDAERLRHHSNRSYGGPHISRRSAPTSRARCEALPPGLVGPALAATERQPPRGNRLLA